MALGGSPAEALAEAERIFLGRYVIDAPLPWNGLAYVFRAVEPGRVVAVAALPVELAGRQGAEEAFRQKAAALAELHHGALLPITEIGVEHDVPYLQSDYVEARTLAQQVTERGALDRTQALAVADAVLDLLELAHASGWLHLDLTPSNVLFADKGDGAKRVIVLGLGFRSLAREAGGDGTDLRERGSGPNAGRYLAPEVAEGRGEARSDLYSVGALLHLMVTGTPPSPGASSRTAGWAASVIDRALAARPSDRFADARSMRVALRRAAEEPAEPPTRKRRGRGVAFWVIGALICLAVGAASALGWMRWHRSVTLAPMQPAGQQVRGPASRAGSEGSADHGEPARDAGVTRDAGAVRDAGAANKPPPPPPSGPLAGGAPASLQAVYARTERHERLSRDDLAPVYAYAKAHPDDPRADLILAHAFVDLTWYTAAIERYGAAARIAPDARHDPRMLPDLIEMLSHPTVFDPAAGAIRTIFGAEAVAPLRKYLADNDLPEGLHRRLKKYLDSLSGAEPAK